MYMCTYLCTCEYTQGQISKVESEKQKLFVSIGSLRESIEEMEEQKLSVLNERRSKEKKHREIIVRHEEDYVSS